MTSLICTDIFIAVYTRYKQYYCNLKIYRVDRDLRKGFESARRGRMSEGQKFSNIEEELAYWKEKALEYKKK